MSEPVINEEFKELSDYLKEENIHPEIIDEIQRHSVKDA
jgi:hypothetical protein